MKNWSEKLNVPLPECGQCGACCICASPSVPSGKLLEKAANGDEFARDFLSIFIPYKDIKTPAKLFPEIIERSLKAFKKAENNLEPVFYKCRYLSETNSCLIYEDRPNLCREFPGIPQVIVGKQCSFYNWTKECRKKYDELKRELEILKSMQKELENIKYQQKAINTNYLLKRIPAEYKFLLTCPESNLISPGKSFY